MNLRIDTTAVVSHNGWTCFSVTRVWPRFCPAYLRQIDNTYANQQWSMARNVGNLWT